MPVAIIVGNIEFRQPPNSHSYYSVGNLFQPLYRCLRSCRNRNHHSCRVALAYRFQMFIPEFPYLFPERDIEASNPKLMKDHNRCILCKRCIRAVTDEEGHRLFAYVKRGEGIGISIDTKFAADISDELADYAAEVCPVGAIIRKGRGFAVPVGQRKYDGKPIGSDIETAE